MLFEIFIGFCLLMLGGVIGLFYAINSEDSVPEELLKLMKEDDNFKLYPILNSYAEQVSSEAEFKAIIKLYEHEMARTKDKLNKNYYEKMLKIYKEEIHNGQIFLREEQKKNEFLTRIINSQDDGRFMQGFYTDIKSFQERK